MIFNILAGIVEAFVVVLIARALLSWTFPKPGSPLMAIERVLAKITEPVLAPVRRLLPPVRAGGIGIDLSFILVILVAQIVIIPLLRR